MEQSRFLHTRQPALQPKERKWQNLIRIVAKPKSRNTNIKKIKPPVGRPCCASPALYRLPRPTWDQRSRRLYFWFTRVPTAISAQKRIIGNQFKDN